MAATFTKTIARLRAAGVRLVPIDIAKMLDELIAANRTIMYYEGARFHEQRYKEYGDRLEHMAALVREGLQIPAQTYDETRRGVERWRARVAEIYKATPVILVPAATGARAARPPVDWRFEHERAVDQLGAPGDYDSDARRRRPAARPPADGRARPGGAPPANRRQD